MVIEIGGEQHHQARFWLDRSGFDIGAVMEVVGHGAKGDPSGPFLNILSNDIRNFCVINAA